MLSSESSSPDVSSSLPSSELSSSSSLDASSLLSSEFSSDVPASSASSPDVSSSSSSSSVFETDELTSEFVDSSETCSDTGALYCSFSVVLVLPQAAKAKIEAVSKSVFFIESSFVYILCYKKTKISSNNMVMKGLNFFKIMF